VAQAALKVRQDLALALELVKATPENSSRIGQDGRVE
jgi:hypothetical protein